MFSSGIYVVTYVDIDSCYLDSSVNLKNKNRIPPINYRARGLVGYDVALTWRRSPVQIWPGPL